MNEQPTIDETLTQWHHPESTDQPLLVMLHGYGADEHDLFGLAPHLPGGMRVASVAAPLDAPHPAPGRMWFPLDRISTDPGAVDRAAQAFLTWLDQQEAEAPSVALLGFSQGGMVALQAMRLQPERFDAVLALSSVVTPGQHPGDEALQRRRPPVFWGFGTHDGMFPQPLVEHTARWLPDHSDPTLKLYQGMGHGISQEELADIQQFLRDWLADAGNPRP